MCKGTQPKLVVCITCFLIGAVLVACFVVTAMWMSGAANVTMVHHLSNSKETRDHKRNVSRDIWFYYFVNSDKQNSFWRTYISKSCGWAYFTIYKTASMTTRQLITPDCGFVNNVHSNQKYWHHCGSHDCTMSDINAMKNDTIIKDKMIFVRHPLLRVISSYNFKLENSIRFDKRWFVNMIEKNNTMIANNSIMNYINSDKFTKDYKKSSSISGKFLNKFDRFKFFLLYFRQTLQSDSKYFLKMSAGTHRHFQSQYLAICMYDKLDASQYKSETRTCFDATFVGNVETLTCDLEYLVNNTNNNNILGFNMSPKKKKDILTSQHSTKTTSKWHIDPNVDIEKFDLETILIICEIYWNDFQCLKSYYKIPIQCLKHNKKYKVWNEYCIDLNSQYWHWPTMENKLSKCYLNF